VSITKLLTVPILHWMKYFSHLNTATQLIQQYRGQEPLHHFLKNFFRQYKKFGSKDRKRITHLCYVFYRVGAAFRNQIPAGNSESIQQVILTGLFLYGNEQDGLLGIMKPSWNQMMAVTAEEKANIINREDLITPIDLSNIFPFSDELSEGINKDAFTLSHLHQPDLFIRIRPGYQEAVLNALGKHDIQYELLPDSAVRLPNGLRVDEIFEVDKEVVVQDLNSQRIGEFLYEYRSRSLLGYRSLLDKSSQFDYRSLLHYRLLQNVSVWDCCAASGGKSIMAKDILGDIDLTVSDIRESIMINLKKRFQRAGVTRYNSLITDLSQTNSSLTLDHSPFDLIIADLPCTGSGTWSRSPEQLYFFEPAAIKRYSSLQKRIAANLIPNLKRDGKLLYITCSVFKKENEEIIHFLQERFPLKVEKMELLKGYEKKADTMFAALLSHL
jgi:16S rRNA (cytosine967-C5)-methyltransferase